MSDRIRNYIDGAFAPARSGNRLDVFEPATGEVYAQLARSDPADVDAAVAAASRATPGWGRTPAEDRAAILHRVADGIERDLERFAEAESRDTGKPLSLARAVDIPRAVANFRFFAAAATQFASEAHAGPGAINYTLRRPLGVVGCISPWNLPLYLFSWKVAPALAAGNAVVGKPSEVTPATAAMLAAVCEDAGLPPGVLNIVNGPGAEAGAALVDHPGVAAVSFTGSTATGAAIARATADRFTRLSLEMGGKNPAIVFADADIDHAAREVVRAAFSNQGQICLCTPRVLVQDGVYDAFRERVLNLTGRLRVGDPLDADTDQGALVSQAHYDKVTASLQTALDEGGTQLGGGPVSMKGRCAGGWFVAPAWFEGLANEARSNQEEIFGPVATLQTFSDDEEALRLANGTRYGLACSIWSSNLARAHRLAAALDFGITWVNCWMQRDLRTPFGGHKVSGYGREGGWEAMRFFTEATNVCIDHGG